MIEFRKEWARGMDGSELVASRICQPSRGCHGRIGDAIDFALGVVCDNAETPKGAVAHLDYIMAELKKARENIAKTEGRNE